MSIFHFLFVSINFCLSQLRWSLSNFENNLSIFLLKYSITFFLSTLFYLTTFSKISYHSRMWSSWVVRREYSIPSISLEIFLFLILKKSILPLSDHKWGVFLFWSSHFKWYIFFYDDNKKKHSIALCNSNKERYTLPKRWNIPYLKSEIYPIKKQPIPKEKGI